MAPTAEPAGPPPDPFAIVGPLDQEKLPGNAPEIALQKMTLPKLGPGTPRLPKSCDSFTKRKAAGKLRCANHDAALEALAQALGEKDAGQRDALLLDVEACKDLPVGLVRALRADLGPTECADGIVERLVATPPKGMSGVVYDALAGLALAGRLARTVTDPPKLEAPYDKKRVEEFHKGPLGAWGMQNAAAIQELAKLGAGLSYYGKAVAAVEAGMADMRFVETVRDMPVPDEYRADHELLDSFYIGLDRALEPRKARGRDAALVGLRGLALIGAIRDDRLARARQLLSRMYGGRPIVALDSLIMPVAPVATPTNVPERLAAALPTFYAGLLLDPARATDRASLAVLAQRGLPLAHRIVLRAAALSPEVRTILGRARIELGRTYWRASDFDEAAALLKPSSDATAPAPEQTFLFALSLALRGGPVDAAAMIRTAPIESLGIGRTAALDTLTPAQSNAFSGLAAFDAALVRHVGAPPEAPVGYWRDVAHRYQQAQQSLTDPAAQALAGQRAEEAEATAKAIEASKPAAAPSAADPPGR